MNENEFKKRFKEALQDIISQLGAADNKTLETKCMQLLDQKLKKFSWVEPYEFKKNYKDYKNLISKNHEKIGNGDFFDFNDILLSKGIPDDFLIIRDPNGSQKSPDIMVIFQKKGIPIEIKSTKKDQPLWNSGYPRKNYFYIINSYEKHRKIALTLGQDLISDKEREKLLSIDREFKDFVKKYNEEFKKDGSFWTFYPRAMYNSNQNLFDERMTERKNKALNYIDNICFQKPKYNHKPFL